MHRFTSLVVSVVLVAACSDDPTGPNGPGDRGPLRAEAVVVETRVGEVADQPAWIECRFTLSGTYARSASGVAAITGAVLRFHAGPDRSEPIDSLVIDGPDLRAAFGGSNQLDPGETLTSRWYFRADIPYTVTGTLRWVRVGSGDDVRGAPFEFTCGPQLEEEPPPVLANVFLSPSDGLIEAGRTMQVHFDASSQLGLWDTWVIVESAIAVDTIRLSESLRGNTSHIVDVRHPIGTPAGTRLAIQVVAFDAWLRPAVSGVMRSAMLYDDDAPYVTHFHLDFDNHVCTPRECQFPDNAPVPFYFSGWDVGGLGFARLELGDPVVWRDSAALVWSNGYRFPASLHGLDGVFPVRGSISDVSDNRVDFGLGEANVYPAVGAGMTTELLLQMTYAALPDFERGRLFLVPTSGPVLVHDIGTLAQIGTIDVPYHHSTHAAVMPDGSVAIGHFDGKTISIGHGSAMVDTLVIDESALSPDLTLRDLVSTAIGTVVVLLDNLSGSYVIELDPATGTQRTILEAVQTGIDRIARSGDGSRLVFYAPHTCGRTYDVATRALGDCVPVDGVLTGSTTGDRWANSRTVYGASLTPIGPLDSEAGYPAAPGPSGSSYVATRRGLMRFDETTGLIRESRHIAEYAASATYLGGDMSVSPDGTIAVIAGRPQSGVNTSQTLVTVVRLN